MNMSIIEKLKLVFDYTFSSFLSIELFIFCLLFFCLLIFGIKRRNKIFLIGMPILFLGFLFSLVVFNFSYVSYCIDRLLKQILNYIYFPSTVVYFFLFVLVTILIIWTIFSKKLSTFKRVFNYLFFSILFFFFFSFVAFAYYEGVALADPVQLYENRTILAIVQISNFVFLFWFLFTSFYQLFLLFQQKYDDKKKVDNV